MPRPTRPVEGPAEHVITGSVPARAVSQFTGPGLAGPSVPSTSGRVTRRAEEDLGRRAVHCPGNLAGQISYGRSNGMWRSLVSAPALGAGGREFESRHPDQTLRS